VTRRTKVGPRALIHNPFSRAAAENSAADWDAPLKSRLTIFVCTVSGLITDFAAVAQASAKILARR